MPYKVWSTYPPALWHGPSGLKLAAGTVHKVTKGKVALPADYTFPAGTTLQEFSWVRPAPPKLIQPKTRKVQGSKGNTYIITTHANGKESCTCPGFQYRRFCKHTGAK